MISRSDDLIEIMKERRSCRAFEENPIPDECIQKILEAGRWAPSGSNMQPWDILIVRDREKRARFVEILEKMIKIDLTNEKSAGGAFPYGGAGIYQKRSNFFHNNYRPQILKGLWPEEHLDFHNTTTECRSFSTEHVADDSRIGIGYSNYDDKTRRQRD